MFSYVCFTVTITVVNVLLHALSSSIFIALFLERKVWLIESPLLSDAFAQLKGYINVLRTVYLENKIQSNYFLRNMFKTKLIQSVMSPYTNEKIICSCQSMHENWFLFTLHLLEEALLFLVIIKRDFT